jgi:SAM-dependent methyltransferase
MKTERLHHPHKSAVNWLIYDLIDAHLLANTHLYRGTLYDLGCGEKPYEGFFLRYCERYVGVDWGGTFHQMTADVVANLNEPLPLEADVADTVVSISVLEHLSEPGVMLGEAHRLLRPGGALVMEVPFMWHVHEAPHDYFRFTRHGLEYLLGKAGFVDIRVEAISGFWAMRALKLNYQLARLIRGGAFARTLIGKLLTPWLWVNQRSAVVLDAVWPHSAGETVGYFVTARKHGSA